ncbi:glycosyltransferase family 39 protein [Microbacterium sp. SORGH_AS_0888]|uniref:glycosyltransferase family 39 protein n=1 Tax=Microbacterium sp. SORGH_AS_0888 TaxID=3041791 RepID=UPI00278974E6|nr:glycosyltransferase family 39 protein [Microbacterium sp. SORGH_AS_0888]MDQ1128325.1 4-amino-4-deoxy-L-arabinose transferase-like glycosyltransferase [Microbacterium sp. SORGH_AS_0888]
MTTTLSTPHGTVRRALWPIGLVVLGVAAFALTAWGVAGSMSEYYGAIALSMSRTWTNFFFGAFDPAGTVTLDKIPGSFWIPALAVKIFGFSPAAVIIPNALAAVGAVLVAAFTARRLVGVTTGLLAGAIVATTPILVAVARSNQPESFFVLALSLVAWAAVRAVERASLRWYIVAGLMVALAFQTYMLEAWAVWPALAAAYLCTRQRWWRRIWHSLVAGTISLAASVVWVTVVSLIPASARPYVGGTNGNNPWEMVFGYNGLGRFSATTSDDGAYRSFTPAFSGSPSVFRLFNEQLAGQIAWLIPAAALAIVVLAVLRWRPPIVVFLGGWLVTDAVMFSVVAGMHQFYTASLAIPLALLISLAFGVARSRGLRWPRIALLATGAVTAVGVASLYSAPSPAIAWVQAALALGGIALISVERRWMRLRAVTAIVVTAGMLLTPAAWSLVTVWSPSSINPTAAGVAGIDGGPGGFGAFGGTRPGAGVGAPGAGFRADGGMRGARGLGAGATPNGTGRRAPSGAGSPFGASSTSANAALLEYLEAYRTDKTEYLVATFGAQTAASLIVESNGGSVLPIGGFDGSDSVPTLAQFQQLVADGKLTYVLGSGMGGGFGRGAFSAVGPAMQEQDGSTASAQTGRTARGAESTTTSSSTQQISEWVTANCTIVPNAPTSETLYSCAAA